MEVGVVKEITSNTESEEVVHVEPYSAVARLIICDFRLVKSWWVWRLESEDMVSLVGWFGGKKEIWRYVRDM